MPEHETSDDNDRVCPYCDARYQVEAEDRKTEWQVLTCYRCGRKYHALDEVTWTHIASADCSLNGEVHEFTSEDGYPPVCAKCGERQTDADEEDVE